MKLCIKKVYCPSCQRLVRCREQKNTGSSIEVVCSKCGQSIWVWDDIFWRYAPKQA